MPVRQRRRLRCGRRCQPLAAHRPVHLDVRRPAEATSASLARVLRLAVHVAMLTQVAPLGERLPADATQVQARRRRAPDPWPVALGSVGSQLTQIREAHAAVVTLRGVTGDVTSSCHVDARQQPRDRLQNQAGMLCVSNWFCMVTCRSSTTTTRNLSDVRHKQLVDTRTLVPVKLPMQPPRRQRRNVLTNTRQCSTRFNPLQRDH